MSDQRIPGEEAALGGPGSAAIRVLIAEDDASLRLALTEMILGEPALELAGAVADAGAAVEAARAEKPQVALVDVRMPGGGGAAAARGIREASPGTRVLAFSGDHDGSTEDEMLAAGALRFLVKGAPIEEIVAAIRSAAGEPA